MSKDAKKVGLNPMDLSINAVLDVTPRKIGKLGWKLGKAIWHKATNREVKKLRNEIEELKTQLA